MSYLKIHHRVTQSLTELFALLRFFFDINSVELCVTL